MEMATRDGEVEKQHRVPAKYITWTKSFDYILSLMGMVVGLGNVWRFPYLCYKNGGGAFLIAYWFYILVLILPLIALESAIGQFTGYSPVKAWNLVPLFRGIGNAMPVLMFYCNLFYPMLLAWALRWFVASFSSDMPWTHCDNDWNTIACMPLFRNSDAVNATSLNTTQLATNISSTTSSNITSSVEEFWRIHILGLTAGIEDLGGIKPDLFACFTLIWVGTYFSIWKGISWTSKIVYVTATLPVAMLTVVTIRGVTLEGANAGLLKYLKPEMSNLKNVELWTDAASQVLFSLCTCSGSLTVLSSYNKFNHNFFRDSILLTALNALASFLSGLAIFSVLGFLAHEQNVTIDQVAESGPGLVFVAYPTALSLLPIPQFWSALFFLTLIFIGFDSMFVFQETFMSCLRDAFGITHRKISREVWTAFVCVFMYLLGFPMATRGGMYVLHIFNTYSITGWCLYFISMNELVAIGWVYGADKLLDNIKTMIGYDIPRWWMKICWKFVGPSIGMALMILSLQSYQPLEYDRVYKYPIWADALGWFTALSSVLCIPITAFYVLWKADGDSIVKKLRSSIVPKISSKQSDGEHGNYQRGLISSTDKQNTV